MSALFILSTPANAAKPLKKSEPPSRATIEKARSLILQQKRKAASQVLITGLAREGRGSPAYKDFVRALDELMIVFFSDRAQSAFALAETLAETKPNESIDLLNEHLKTEDDNLMLLLTIARIQITQNECDRALNSIKVAEALHPVSSIVRLAKIQSMDCLKDYVAVEALLQNHEVDLSSIEKFLRPVQMRSEIRKKDFKRARQILMAWESSSKENPEVFYWQWQLSQEFGPPDRAAAIRYSQACSNLTVRQRKALSLDLDLCRAKASVDELLKSSGFQPSAPQEAAPNG